MKIILFMKDPASGPPEARRAGCFFEFLVCLLDVEAMYCSVSLSTILRITIDHQTLR
jgi:hypothetical protein